MAGPIRRSRTPPARSKTHRAHPGRTRSPSAPESRAPPSLFLETQLSDTRSCGLNSHMEIIGNNFAKLRYKTTMVANVATVIEISTQLGEYVPHAAPRRGRLKVGTIMR